MLSVSSLSTSSAKPQQASHPVVSKLYKILSLTPSEVTHDMSITRSADGKYQLDESRIEQLKMNYAHNFKMRAHLAKVTYAITAGSMLWLGYKWGAFDWLLSSKAAAVAPLAVPVIADPTSASPLQIAEYFKARQTYDQAKDAALNALFAQIEKNDEKAGNWFINGAKYVGWTGVSIIGGLLVQSKWHSLFSYVLAEPSFKWFLMNHSIVSTIEGFKRSVQALTSPNLPSEFSQEYHTMAIDPALESIVRNIEQYIAFTDFYLDQLDEEMIHKQAMDSVPRYLFNLTNDFLAKIHVVIINPAGQVTAPAIVDEYKADVVTCINRCKVFEKEFVEGV